MAGKQAQTVEKCPNCSKESPRGLHYCQFCGAKNGGNKDLLPSAPVACPFCHCVDEFNTAFCVICGGQINQAEASTRLKALPKATGFNWSVAAAQAGGRSAGGGRSTVSMENRTKVAGSPLLMFCLPGALIGICAAAAVNFFSPELINRLVARLQCPSGGLAIYLRPQEASDMGGLTYKNTDCGTITIESIPNGNAGSTKQTIQTDKEGLVTWLPATSNKEGADYRLIASMPNHESAVTSSIKVKPNLLTLVGFAAPHLVLPRLTPEELLQSRKDAARPELQPPIGLPKSVQSSGQGAPPSTPTPTATSPASVRPSATPPQKSSDCAKSDPLTSDSTKDSTENKDQPYPDSKKTDSKSTDSKNSGSDHSNSKPDSAKPEPAKGNASDLSGATESDLQTPLSSTPKGSAKVKPVVSSAHTESHPSSPKISATKTPPAKYKTSSKFDFTAQTKASMAKLDAELRRE